MTKLAPGIRESRPPESGPVANNAKLNILAGAIASVLSAWLPQLATAATSPVGNGNCNTLSPTQDAVVSCDNNLSGTFSGVATPENDTGNNNVSVTVFQGTVLSVNGPGIVLGADSTVVNEGTLFTQTSVNGYGMAAGLGGRSDAGGNWFQNQTSGVVLTQGVDAHGMFLHAGADAKRNRITNRGSVTTEGDRASGLRVSTQSTTATDLIENFGSITTGGAEASGIRVETTQAPADLQNKGTITVTGGALAYGIHVRGAASILNTGTINAGPSGVAVFFEDNGNASANSLTLTGDEVAISGALSFSATRTDEKLTFEAMGEDSAPFAFDNDITGLNILETASRTHVSLGSANGYTFTRVNTDSNSTLTVAGAIGGSGGLHKQGDGTLKLSGTNTYAGATRVDAGYLFVESDDALSAGTLILDGGNNPFAVGAMVRGGVTVANALEIGSTTTATEGAILYSMPTGTPSVPERSTVSGSVLLKENLSLASFSQSELELSGAIDGSGGGGQSLSVVGLGGKIILSGGVGQNEALGSVSLTGPTELAGNVTTTGTQTYGGALTLGADVALIGEGINSTAAIDGAHALTITDSGNASLANLGESTALSSVAITAKALELSDVKTVGTQTYSTTGTDVSDVIQTNSTYSSEGAAILFNGAVQANDELIVDTTAGGSAGANIVFQGTLNSAPGEANAITLTAGSGTITFGDAVGGLASLGSLTVHSGATLINGGAVRTVGAQSYGDTVSLGAATTISGSGLSAQDIAMGAFGLTVDETGVGEVTGVISGSGGLVKAGAGVLTLSGVNSYSGSTAITAGTLKLGASGAVPGATLLVGANGTFDLNNFDHTVIDLSGAGAITLGTATLTAGAAGDSGFSGVISGSGGLVKAGAGVLTLSGANSYSGTTVVTAGTLQTGAAGALSQSALEVQAGTTFDLNDFDQTVTGLSGAGAITLGTATLTAGAAGDSGFSGVISGSGGLVKAGAGALTLSGVNSYSGSTAITNGTLRLGASGVVPGAALVVGADGTFDLNNFDHTVTDLSGAGAITLGIATLTAGAAGDSGFSGVISGSGGLVKAGAGVLTLSGANSYSGSTVVTAGTLQTGAAGALSQSALEVQAGTTFDLNDFDQTVTELSGAGAITLGTATLTAGAAGDSGFSGVISGSGGLVKAGAGVLTLSGANSYSGSTVVTAGTLQTGAAGALSQSALEVQAGTTFDLNDFDQTVTGLSGAGAITLGTATLTAGAAGDSGFSGVISGSGGLIKAGAGVLTLSGANSYSGSTAITDGTLRLGASGAVPGATLVVGADGTFDLNNFDQTVTVLSGAGAITLGAATLTTGAAGDSGLSGVISGSGGLVKAGAGTLTLSGANSYSGTTVVTAGTLQTGAAGVLSQSALEVQAGTTFDLNDFDQTVTGLSGAGAITLGTATLTAGAAGDSGFSGVISGSGGLVKAGAGVLTLAGANSYSGSTAITAGTLRLGASGVVPGAALVVGADGTFDLNNFDHIVTDLSGAGAITLGIATLTAGAAGDSGFSGVISGSGGLVKAGAGVLTLSGANSYSGSTVVTAGTLQTGAAGALSQSALEVQAGTTFDLNDFDQTVTGLSGAGAITLGTATLTAGAAGDTSFSGVISGSGGLVKAGAGTLTLSGVNNYSGSTAITAGTLKLGASGTVPGAALMVGADGTFDLNNFDHTVTDLSGAGAIALGTATLMAGAAGDSGFSGVISGSGGLVKAGAGVLTLSGASSYSGSTVVTAGTLQTGAAGALSQSALEVQAGTTFDLNDFDQTVTELSGVGAITLGTATLTAGAAGDSGFSGVISGSGGLIKAGAGTLTLSGANSYSGSTVVTAGTLQTGAAGALSQSALEIQAGTTFDLNDFDQTVTGLSGAGAITLGTATLTAGAAGDSGFSGVISGSGGLLKVGAGTLILSGANAYSGSTVVAAGTLQTGAAGVLSQSALEVQAGTTFDLNDFDQTVTGLSGAGAITLGTATLTAGAAGDSGFSGVISGSGGLIKAGAGTLTLAGANSYSGTTVVTAGTLQTGAAGALSQSALEIQAGTTFDLNDFDHSVTDLSGAGAITLGTATLTAGAAGDTSFSGVISGSGGLVKAGAGTLTLSGANSYSGSTAITAGTLKLGASGAVPGAALVVGADGTFDLNNFDHTVTDLSGAGAITLGTATLTAGAAGDSEFSGVISGSGGLVKAGAGALTLSGANAYSGSTVVTAGTLQTGAAGVLSQSALEVQAGTTFDLNDFGQTVTGLSGAGAITLGTATLTAGAAGDSGFSGVISGSGGLVKAGAGVLTLSGANSYSGSTVVTAGTLQTGTEAALSQSALEVQAGTTFDLNDFDQTVTELSGAGAITLGTATLTAGAAGDSGFSGVISGSGGLVKAEAGVLTLSGANAYSGSTAITAGTLKLGASGAVPGATLVVGADGTFDLNNFNHTVTDLSGAGAITLGTATLTAGAAGDSEFSGVISGSGGLVKAGAGVLALSGANAYSGSTAITAGTLRLGASRAVPGAALVVGADGTFDLNNFDHTVTDLSGAGAITLGTATLTAGVAGDSEFSGVISGSGGLVKAGAGVLTLSGANSYSGTTVVTAGTLQTGAAGALSQSALEVQAGTTFDLNDFDQTVTELSGAGAITLGTVTLTAGAAGDSEFSGVISGSGGLVKRGEGTLVLPNPNSYTGGTVLEQGRLVVGSNTALGTGQVEAAGVDVVLQAGKADLTMRNDLLLTRDLIVDTSGEAVRLTGSVAGEGRLIKFGTGTLIVTSDNSFSGGTEVASGTLALGVDAASSTGEIVMAADTTIVAETALVLENAFKLRGAVVFDTQDFSVTLNNTLSNNSVGRLIKTGSGALTLNGANEYSGGTLIQEGVLRLNGSLASGIEVRPDTTLSGAGAIFGDLLNFGTVVPGASGQRSTLLVSGDYVGQGGIFSTRVYGNAGILEADQLLVQGEGNSASGTTAIHINFPRELFGLATPEDGILLVDIAEGATSSPQAFTAPTVTAGAFHYRLVQGGASSTQSWYLRSEARKETTLYASMPMLTREYLWSISGSLDTRRGTPGIAGSWDSRPKAWGRFISRQYTSHLGGNVQRPSMNADEWGFQLGADLVGGDTAWGQWRFGPMLTVGRSVADTRTNAGLVRSGDVSLSAVTAGFNAALAGHNGAYADALMQRTRITELVANSPEGSNVVTRGWALSGSLEAGWRLPLSERVALTPQVQIHAAQANFDESSDAMSRVKFPKEEVVLGRLGVKLSYEGAHDGGTQTQLWARASTFSILAGKTASASLSDLQGVNSAEFGNRSPERWGALEMGGRVYLNDRASLELGLGYQGAFTSAYRSLSSQLKVLIEL